MTCMTRASARPARHITSISLSLQIIYSLDPEMTRGTLGFSIQTRPYIFTTGDRWKPRGECPVIRWPPGSGRAEGVGQYAGWGESGTFPVCATHPPDLHPRGVGEMLPGCSLRSCSWCSHNPSHLVLCWFIAGSAPGVPAQQ